MCIALTVWCKFSIESGSWDDEDRHDIKFFPTKEDDAAMANFLEGRPHTNYCELILGCVTLPVVETVRPA